MTYKATCYEHCYEYIQLNLVDKRNITHLFKKMKTFFEPLAEEEPELWNL